MARQFGSHLAGVDVAVARTLPELGERAEVREIEALYLAAIAGAEHTLYIESQYLASRTLAEAIAARLREDDGPEIVLVIPRNADGWLEQKAMDGARHDLLHLLWSADIHDRFGAFYPVTSSGAPIYVHAKVLVMDDRLLRIGSSNLNNRSMGFDTECDIAVESDDDADVELRASIIGLSAAYSASTSTSPRKKSTTRWASSHCCRRFALSRPPTLAVCANSTGTQSTAKTTCSLKMH